MKTMRIAVTAAVVLAMAAGTVLAQGAPKPDRPIKWSQPVDLLQGYDIYSFWPEGALRPTTMVSDDWRCPDGRPLTDVHWWGSYIDGNPQGLLGFEILIHADIPPDGIHPSHPGGVLYSTVFLRGTFVEQVYAVNSETVYQYNYDLTPPFPQEQGKIYWLSIVGLVDNETTWGWHTGVRPQPDNTLDDAVLIFDFNPQTGKYLTYNELFDSQGSVAMAFELTTIPEPATLLLVASAGAGLALLRRRLRGAVVLLVALTVTLAASGTLFAPPIGDEVIFTPSGQVKWLQLPDLLTGRDIPSFWSLGNSEPTVIVADDWRCLDGNSVTDIHWWGSYPTGRPVGAQPLDMFLISIFEDIPAAGSTPSHPGPRLWMESVGFTSVGETFIGFDNNSEAVYRYDWIMPEAEWFQQEQGKIYWLSIVGRAALPDLIWGWHTAQRPGPENGLDAAVMIYDYNASTGDYTRWGPLYDFCHVQMAFALTTIPEPSTLALVGTAALAGLGLLRRRRMT